jgi:hypothetical protein
LERSPPEPEPVVWFEDQLEKKAWPARDEVAVLMAGASAGSGCENRLAASLPPQAAVIDSIPGGVVYKLPPSAVSTSGKLDQRIAALKAHPCAAGVGLVYYTGKQRRPATRLIHTDELIVRFRPSLGRGRIAGLESEFGLTLETKLRFAPNTMVYRVHSLRAVIDTANRLRSRDAVLYAYPNWLRRRATK